MKTRLPRKIKDYLINYVKIYANQILTSECKENTYDQFKPETAAEYAIKAMDKKEITKKNREYIHSEEGKERIVDFFKEKLVVNYFMLARGISYYEAKSLLTDKGVSAFEETKMIKTNEYPGRFKDYKATDKQKECIRNFGVKIKHEDELSGREASLIISCLLCKTKTKPNYFTYYIQL